MDLRPTEDQQSIIDLTTTIVADHATADRLRELERGGHSHDEDLWRALADADLVGLAMPEAAGGGGYGLTEAALVSEVIGRHVAPVPFVEAVAAGRLLAAVSDDLAGDVVRGAVVVPALREGVRSAEATTPETRAVAVGDSWELTGEKRLIPGSAAARTFLVPAAADDGVALFAVDADTVADQRESWSTAGQLLRTIGLSATPGRRVPVEDADAAIATLRHELRVLRCAHLAGVAAGALQLAADHCKQREQFGAPIGTFQAVAHRLADAWLDTNTVQATARQAAWRTDHGLPAGQAAASAALWACEGVQRVVHAAQHVHGGIGVDLDYPVHRYFRWAKDRELQLGGGSACARDLGAAIAAEPLTIG